MKILKLIKNIISGILIALLALILFVNIYSIIQRQSSGRNHPNILGYANAIVISGSMSPEIEIDDLVVTKKQAEYHVGDIVTVDNGKSFVTHRIIEETPEGFITKGDANLTVDGYISSEDNFIGKVVWFTSEDSFFIRIVKVLSSPVGFMACIVFPVLAISSLVLRECTKSIMKDLEEANAELDRAEKSDVEAITVSDEEYQEMYERIKRELIEELGINRDERED